jgi:hypothetical protein
VEPRFAFGAYSDPSLSAALTREDGFDQGFNIYNKSIFIFFRQHGRFVAYDPSL